MKTKATPPILIPCEGSGAKGHRHLIATVAMCPMCGKLASVDDTLVMPEHDRVDILTQINRGDYG